MRNWTDSSTFGVMLLFCFPLAGDRGRLGHASNYGDHEPGLMGNDGTNVWSMARSDEAKIFKARNTTETEARVQSR
jgi:hypothetical protein